MPSIHNLSWFVVRVHEDRASPPFSILEDRVRLHTHERQPTTKTLPEAGFTTASPARATTHDNVERAKGCNGRRPPAATPGSKV